MSYEVVRLGDVCDILNGYAFKSEEYVSSGIRIMRITNVQNGYIIDDNPQFYDYSYENTIKNYLLNEGDILMSLTGNVGRVGLMTKEFLPAALNQRVACIRLKKIENPIFFKYLFWVLNSKKMENDCVSNSNGVAQKNLSTIWLKDYKIPLPPLDIQKKIADTLDKAQELIDKRKEQISALDKFLENLFLDMFGDPVSNPMGWEIKSSGNLFYDLVGGHSLMGEARQLLDNEIAVLKISAVTTGKFKSDEYKVVANGVSKNLVFVKKGDLLFSRANTREMVGAVCIVDNDYPQLFLPDKLWRIDLKKECNKYYYKFLISHKKFKQNLTNVATGTSGSMLNISKEKLRDLKIPLPPLDLQNQFASIVEKVEAEKTKLEASLKEMEDNFNSIMQKAFKGELW